MPAAGKIDSDVLSSRILEIKKAFYFKVAGSVFGINFCFCYRLYLTCTYVYNFFAFFIAIFYDLTNNLGWSKRHSDTALYKLQGPAIFFTTYFFK